MSLLAGPPALGGGKVRAGHFLGWAGGIKGRGEDLALSSN